MHASTVVPDEYNSMDVVNANAAKSLIDAHAVWVGTHGTVMKVL